jgi:hypothetical protein
MAMLREKGTSKQLFQKVTADGGPDELPLKPVMGRQTWWSPNAQSQMKAFAEMQLLSYLHDKDCWHLADEAWRVQLLPVGQWVVRTGEEPKRLHYVVEVLGCSAILWPACQHQSKKLFSWSTRAEDTIDWVHCFAFDTFKVVDCKPVSPLHQHGVSKVRNRTDVAFTVTAGKGEALLPLLEWQSRHGFAKVPESIIRLVHAEMGLNVARDGNVASSNEAEVIVDIMRHLEPQLSQVEAQQRLSHRSQELDAPDTMLKSINTEVLRDVVLPQDQDDVRQVLEKKGTTVAKRRDYHQHVAEVVLKHYTVKPAPAAKEGARRKAVPKAQPTLTPAALARKFQQGNRFDFLTEHKPGPAKIVEDNPNGRYLVAYEGYGRKSFSWMRRGDDETAIAVLEHLWSCHVEETGEASPYDWAALRS